MKKITCLLNSNYITASSADWKCNIGLQQQLQPLLYLNNKKIYKCLPLINTDRSFKVRSTKKPHRLLISTSISRWYKVLPPKSMMEPTSLMALPLRPCCDIKTIKNLKSDYIAAFIKKSIIKNPLLANILFIKYHLYYPIAISWSIIIDLSMFSLSEP